MIELTYNWNIVEIPVSCCVGIMWIEKVWTQSFHPFVTCSGDFYD